MDPLGVGKSVKKADGSEADSEFEMIRSKWAGSDPTPEVQRLLPSPSDLRW